LGLILISLSADFLTLFLGMETSSLSIYILAGYMKNWRIGQEAAIKYFFTGSLAAAFLLYGIAFIYGATGSTNFDYLLSVSPRFPFLSQVFFLGGIALIGVGLSFKAAIVPFHAWSPDVYAGSPTPVVAFMAVGIKGGAFAAFLRIFMETFGQFQFLWDQGIEVLALLTIAYGNIVALRQTELRRFFAYSGISHTGILLIPFVAHLDASALSAVLFYLVVYTIATLGSFAILESLERDPRGISFQDMRGLFHRSPFLGGVWILCLLTLAGIPPLAGFFAKFYVFIVGWQAGYYVLVIVALLASILSAFYYLRMIGLTLSDTEQGKESLSPPLSLTTVAVIISALIVILTLFPRIS
jgi:NADH-quinone oxidoreductase subunit N